jgi:hypothetical protein
MGTDHLKGTAQTRTVSFADSLVDLKQNPSVSQGRLSPRLPFIDPFGVDSETTSNSQAGGTLAWSSSFIDPPQNGSMLIYKGGSSIAPSNETPDGTPRWFNYLYRRLCQLEQYSEVEMDDSENYPKPPVAAIAQAWNVACNLFRIDTPTPSVVPAEEGGVEFAWHKYGWDLVISMLAKETTVWARNKLVGENWSSPLSERFEQVQRILEGLSQ